MSEQNVLNATASDQLNPTYGYGEALPEMFSLFQARSGKMTLRQLTARGRVYDLQWVRVSEATAETLRQWESQYRGSFFSYQDLERARYFTGKFLGPLKYTPTGNNAWNVSGQFVEEPGLPMFAYPSNWARDAIFIEEKDDYNADLVKLTGTWDHRTKNYCLRSEEFDNAVWAKNAGTPGFDVVVTPNNATDPLGGSTADTLVFAATGVGQFSTIQQTQSGAPPAPGQTMVFSIYLRAAGATTITIAIKDSAGGNTASFSANVATSFQRFSISKAFPVGAAGLGFLALLFNPSSQASKTIVAWGAQVEYGTNPSDYTKAVAAAVELVSLPPVPGNPLTHGLAAYWNAGTVTTDAAEWVFFGYGFRVWAPANVDMGIMELTCTALDGTVEVPATNIDLYNAAAVASAVVSTQQNLKLGWHRVKLRATNSKNAASSAFIIAADAIEVMR